MKPKFIILSLFLLLNSAYAQEISLDVFPEKKLYEKHFADALVHQFSLARQFENREYSGNIGGNLALADLLISRHPFQLSVASTIFTTLIKTPGHVQVFTVDYLVDIFIDTRITENLAARFIGGHLSAHFSDDGITQLNYFPISYVRDYLGLNTQYKLSSAGGKIYAGLFYNYHNEPETDKNFTYQLGGDISQNLFPGFSLYEAVDIKLKSEVNYATTQSFQVGFRYSSKDSQKAIRLAFTHRRGYEERGQFFNNSKDKNFLGLYFDF